MKKLLLVDDDSALTQAYRTRLSAHGFHVQTATTGTAAITALQTAKPDLVVLDLMMPDVSGVDLLKIIRLQPALAPTPVVILTNTYTNDLGRQAAAVGIQKAFLKSQCSPSVLMACIDEILDPRPPSSETTSVSEASPPPPSEPVPAPSPAQNKPFTPADADESVSSTEVAEDLLAQAPAICADLRKLFQLVAHRPPDISEQRTRLQNLYLSVHSLAAIADSTAHASLIQTALVFQKLLCVLMADPARLSPSVLRTLANLVDFVELLFRRAGESPSTDRAPLKVLVVDDDPLCNRLVVSALSDAGLEPHSTEDPLVAWQWANSDAFDLVLLDVEMPSINGLDLCKRLRGLTEYKHTPLIFVTHHSDFETRAKTSLCRADDLITKPILPMELAAKVVMHLLKRQTAATLQPA